MYHFVQDEVRDRMAWRGEASRDERGKAERRPSLLASGAAERLAGVAVVVVLLWLAVAWALTPVGGG
jgi:hypothetical protein